MKEIIKRAYIGIERVYGRYQIARHGFWFVDIPRTSSSSIRAEFGKRFGSAYGKRNVIEKEFSTSQIFPDHLPAKEMAALIGSSLWKKIFTFTIVRNPWDRIYSMYRYRQKKDNIPRQWSFRDYVLALGKASSDDKFFKHRAFYYGQSEYVLGDNGEIIVDYIAKFENRADDLKFIASRLNLGELGELTIQSATPTGKHYSDYYDSEMKEIVGQIYKKDVELFGYQFEYKNQI